MGAAVVSSSCASAVRRATSMGIPAASASARWPRTVFSCTDPFEKMVVKVALWLAAFAVKPDTGAATAIMAQT